MQQEQPEPLRGTWVFSKLLDHLVAADHLSLVPSHLKVASSSISRLPSAMKSFLIFCLVVLQAGAATYYVDSHATGTNNGSSWANAWKVLPTGNVKPGDTVWISGGPSGSTRTYVVPSIGYWNPPSGTASAWITYKIGQDAQHNGTAVITAGKYQFLSGPRYFTVSGDAGDGGMHIKLSGFDGHEVFSNINAYHLEFIDGSAGIGAIGSVNGNQVEINNCFFNVTDLTADRALYIQFTGSVPSDNKIHHNKILIPHIGPGIGADGIQGGGTGYSITYNHIEGYNAKYTGGQHQDGFQSLGSGTAEIANNDFLNISNYAIYGDAYYDGFDSVNVHDNLVRFTDKNLNTGSPGGIIFGTDGGYAGKSPCTFNNVSIVHNLVVDYYWTPVQNINAGIALNNGTNHPTVFTGCAVTDNAMVNGTTTVSASGNTTSTIKNNTALTATQAATYFAKYLPYGADNNYSPFFSGTPPVVTPPIVVPPVVTPPVVVPPANATINVTVKLVIDPVSNAVLSVSAATQ
jgi:hypothetical protein